MLVSFLASGGALAFCTNCDPVEEFVGNGWTVRLVGIDAIPTGCTGTAPDYPEVPISLDTCYRWNYEIYPTGTNPPKKTGLNFFAMLIPDCCSDPRVYIDENQSIPGNLKVFDIAQGEPTVGFGEYNETGYVIKGTPNNEAVWSIVTNSNSKASLPVAMKVNKSGVLSFELAGPGCATGVISTTEERFTAERGDGVQFEAKVVKDPGGNILSFESRRLDCESPCGFEPVDGIPWDQIRVRYPTFDDYGEMTGYTESEPVVFIPNDTTTRTGENSTCGYWYRGVFWNFCQ